MATDVTKWTDVGRPLTFNEVDANWESIRQAIDVVVESHRIAVDNPHGVTALQVGAPDQATYDAHTAATNPHGLTSGDIGALDSAHVAASNPHGITPTLIGAASTSDVIGYDWKGTYSSAAELLIAHGAPQTGWAYRNTTTPATYYYQGGTWYIMNLDGQGIFYLGEFASPPPTPNYNEVYKNTTNGTLYIWNGASWEVMVNDGSDGVNGSQGLDGNSVYITYHDNAVDNEPAAPAGGTDGNSGGWHTNPTNNSVWMSQKVAASATLGTWGSPIQLLGATGEPGEQGSQGYYLELDAVNGIFFVNRAQETGGEAGAGNPVTYAYSPGSITINIVTNDTNEVWSSAGLTVPLSGSGSSRTIAEGDLSGEVATITVTTDNMTRSITLTKTDASTGTYIGSDGVFTGFLSAIQINAGQIATQRLLVDESFALSAGGSIQSTTYTPGSAGFSIDADGSAEFDDITARGHIESSSGTIGGWTLGASQLTGGAAFLDSTGIIKVAQGGSQEAGMSAVDSGDTSTRFWAGSTYANRNTAPFRVEQGGTVHMDSGFIGGVAISSVAHYTDSTTADDLLYVAGTERGLGDGSSFNNEMSVANFKIWFAALPKIINHFIEISFLAGLGDLDDLFDLDIEGFTGTGTLQFNGDIGDCRISDSTETDAGNGYLFKISGNTCHINLLSLEMDLRWRQVGIYIVNNPGSVDIQACEAGAFTAHPNGPNSHYAVHIEDCGGYITMQNNTPRVASEAEIATGVLLTSAYVGQSGNTWGLNNEVVKSRAFYTAF